MIKKTACVLLALMTLLLGGCWNNRDVSDLAIVTGIGIDKAADGGIEFTAQVISTEKSGDQHSGLPASNGGGSADTVTVTSEGATIFDAARNLIPKLSKKAYYSHVQLLVIGDQAAKEGLDEVWDFFERDHEVGRLFRLIVVKNGAAKTVMEAKSGIETIGAVEVANTLDNPASGKSVDIKAFKVSELLSEPLTGIVAGVIEPDGSDQLTDMKVEGGAVFKNAKLTGYLDNDQTRGYLFASNQMESTILTVANPKETGKLVSLEVINSTGKLTAELEGGKPKFGIEIKVQGNIGDEQGSADLTDEDDVKALEGEAEQLITANINDMMEKSQKVYDSDILNFNNILYMHDYTAFEKIKGSWNKLYGDADIGINVQFTIVRPGIIKKPAYS